ncbi:serine/threonine protein phosphatase [Shewanella gelidii]|uniref:Serine/threonine protein phosphatase n=1 Tax=Shewanella gelidii TaxID=1642821 RepID=A0A917JM24_9GAMM|nr:serine/threonine protein phosphatase [Shewanella gelidii]MCL1097559.1 serine/threonine protein phosphatase [Shewanella gelidii]GGI76234.1 hypothetical protein GCM10009332_12040 [Shewanella gelidii]
MKLSSLEKHVQSLRQQQPNKRVFSFEYEHKKYWLKQVEKVRGAMKLLKSDPQQLLTTEIDTLKRYNQLKAPVPVVACSGTDFVVIEDAGVTLKHLFLKQKLTTEQALPVVQVVGKALAELHAQGLNHGRPALRDIAWRDGKVTFIDFEAYRADMDILSLQSRDLLVLIHSFYRDLGEAGHTLVHQAVAAYREAGGEDVWQHALAKMRRLSWLEMLLRPIKPIAGKDLRPLYPMMDFIKSF